MSCPLEEHLTAYVDGELDEVLRRKLDGHLPGCVECARTIELLSGAVATLRAAPPRDVPAELRKGVLAQVEPRALWRRPRTTLALGAIAAMAAGVAVALFIRAPAPTEPSAELVADPIQWELAQNLEALDDLELLDLEDADDLEVIGRLHELEARP